MLTFIMLTHLSPEAARSPQALEQLALLWQFFRGSVVFGIPWNHFA